MKNKSPLLENVTALLLLQGANYLLPLITFPYLVRVLGAEGFGLNAFAQSVAAYFIIVTDYGFSLSATRAIAVHKGDVARVSRIFSSVIVVKLLLLLSCAGALLVALLASSWRTQWVLHCAAFLAVLGNALFPGWLFQGLERMRYVTLVNVGSRCIATAAVFLFVHSSADYSLAVGIQSGGVVLAGVWGLFLARFSLGVRWSAPSGPDIRAALRDGWHVFVSQASTSLFGNSNVFILGLFASPAVVGRFAVAEKIVRAIISLSIPITGAIFPVASSLFSRSREEALTFLRRVAVRGAAVFLLLGLALFLGADLAVRLVTGQMNPQAAGWVRIMSLVPLSVFIDNIYGTQILLNIGEQRRFMYAVLLPGVCSIVASLMTVPAFGGTASAVVFTASELLVMVLMIAFVRGAGIRVLRVRA